MLNWKKIGFNFDNSYLELPSLLYTRIDPVKVNSPSLVMLNKKLSQELGLNFEGVTDDELASIFSGNLIPEGAEPISQAYAGHQFGYFNILGDGRANLLGEHITPSRKRVDIQLKGSGKTPYSRRGDGRAALAPMLREYVISEAMNALKIPTTRSLAVVTTGEPVFRESMLKGAVLVRVAASHIRVGTFEYLAAHGDLAALKNLADYTINRHYPELENSQQPYLDLIKKVMEKQIFLVVEWLRVGFIHGVMNTDNMVLSGETIDYGPCAFMDYYDPNTVFSSIDNYGRYAYANQPSIAQWNLARFAEAILPLLNEDIEAAQGIAEDLVKSFNKTFQDSWLQMMLSKIGLSENKKGDESLVADLLKCMQKYKMDYTNTFRDLISDKIPRSEIYDNEEFTKWWHSWQLRLKTNNEPAQNSFALMKTKNPVVIPRNHIVEKALQVAETESDFSLIDNLLAALSEPYEENLKYKIFYNPPSQNERVYKTFCGT